MIMINNNLDIGDVNMFILRGNDSTGSFKELVCGYKTIYLGVYTLDIFDMTGEEEKRATLLRHESFQLWESKVSGMIQGQPAYTQPNTDKKYEFARP